MSLAAYFDAQIESVIAVQVEVEVGVVVQILHRLRLIQPP